MITKVSVVIPAYNAAKTVEATVRNVLNSTIPLEVWVVDDGSTDGTGEMLDRLSPQYCGQSCSQSTVHILHQENCGAYQARLNVLKQITTPYFGFVDADDSVESTMFEKMFALAKRKYLDVVQCGIDGATNSSRGIAGGRTVIDGDVFERWKYSYPVDVYDSCFIWDKLYRNQYDFNAFYTCRNLDEMHAALKLVVEDRQDPRRDERQAAAREAGLFGNNAAERVAKYLNEILS